jgi:hypothetical protein
MGYKHLQASASISPKQHPRQHMGGLLGSKQFVPGESYQMGTACRVPRISVPEKKDR